MKPFNVLWNAAPAGLKPVAGKVDVFSARWMFRPSGLKTAQSLSGDEWHRAERFHLERDHRRFVASRGTLREILAALLGTHPASLTFAYREFGKLPIAAPIAVTPSRNTNWAWMSNASVRRWPRPARRAEDQFQSLL